MTPRHQPEAPQPLAPHSRHRRLSAWVLCVGLLLGACGADSAQSLVASGKALSQKRDFRGAVVQFKAALQEDGRSLETRNLLGNALVELGDPTQAAIELGRAVEQRPAPDSWLADHARALLQVGDLKTLTSSYAETALQDAAAQASLKASLASAWSAMGQAQKAESAAAAALAAKPDFGPALVLRARLLASGGNDTEATAVMDQLLAREPGLPEAWHLKADILWHVKRDREGAMLALEKALQAKPSHLPSHLALVQLHLAVKDFAAAKEQVGALRKALPNHPHATFVDAQIAFLERNHDHARELVLQVIKGSPNHVGALQLAGAIEAQSGSHAMAEHYLGKVLQLKPELVLARRRLAQVQLRLGQPVRALATLQPALRKSEASAEDHALAGEAQLLLGDTAGAEASFERTARLVPDNRPARAAVALAAPTHDEDASLFGELDLLPAAAQVSTTELALISAKLRRQENDLALAAAQDLLRKQPQSAAAAYLIGRVQLVRRDSGAARLAFEHALMLNTHYFAATSSLAALDLVQKKIHQARERFEAAIKLDPRNHLARMSLAELRLSQGAPTDEVNRLLVDAIRASPGEVGPRLMLVGNHFSTKKYKEALVVAQQARAAFPNDTGVLDALGRAQADSGDRLQAINSFKRLAELNPTSGLAHLRLADVHKLSGDLAAAEANLQKALDIEPELQSAQSGLLDLLLATNRHNDALQMAQRFQRRRPTESAGYLLEAAVHVRARAANDSIESYRKGLEKVINGSELATALHKALVANNRWAEADQLAKRWTAGHPEDQTFEYQVATSAISRGNLEAAEEGLRQLLVRRPDHALALNDMAWVLAARGKPGAVHYARKAVEILPEQPALMNTLALALAANKQVAEALDIQKRAVNLSPFESSLRLNLAKIATQAGDKELARSELQALHAVGAALPSRDEVLKLLSSL